MYGARCVEPLWGTGRFGYAIFHAKAAMLRDPNSLRERVIAEDFRFTLFSEAVRRKLHALRTTRHPPPFGRWHRDGLYIVVED